MQNNHRIVIATKILGLLAALVLSGCAGHYQRALHGNEPFFKQATVFSVQDSMPGHSAHQLALLIPPEEHVLYSGTLTYTASKPVEVVVLHEYSPTQEPDKAHDVLFVGQIGEKNYAISVLQFPNTAPITDSATVPFTGSALALHTLNGEPFTATFSLNAVRHEFSS